SGNGRVTISTSRFSFSNSPMASARKSGATNSAVKPVLTTIEVGSAKGWGFGYPDSHRATGRKGEGSSVSVTPLVQPSSASATIGMSTSSGISESAASDSSPESDASELFSEAASSSRSDDEDSDEADPSSSVPQPAARSANTARTQMRTDRVLVFKVGLPFLKRIRLA